MGRRTKDINELRDTKATVRLTREESDLMLELCAELGGISTSNLLRMALVEFANRRKDE